MTIDDGMVDVLSGGWFVTGRSSPIGSSNNDIVATNVDFRVNAALELNAKIRARDYEAAYGYNYCIAGREMGKILGKLGKRSLGGENENPVEDGFNGVGMGLE